jgi:hypothetical protein
MNPEFEQWILAKYKSIGKPKVWYGPNMYDYYIRLWHNKNKDHFMITNSANWTKSGVTSRSNK